MQVFCVDCTLPGLKQTFDDFCSVLTISVGYVHGSCVQC